MGHAKTIGHQQLDGLPQQLLPRITENLFSLGVDHFDRTILIGHQHAARRVLNHAPETLFGARPGRDLPSQPLVGCLQLRSAGQHALLECLVELRQRGLRLATLEDFVLQLLDDRLQLSRPDDAQCTRNQRPQQAGSHDG
jgi:hypothetical protein